MPVAVIGELHGLHDGAILQLDLQELNVAIELTLNRYPAFVCHILAFCPVEAERTLVVADWL